MKPIGIDTNVLLRMVLNDDPGQRVKALAFGEGLTEEVRGFVSLLVLIEFNWSLLSRYRQSKEQTLAAITSMERGAQEEDILFSYTITGHYRVK